MSEESSKGRRLWVVVIVLVLIACVAGLLVLGGPRVLQVASAPTLAVRPPTDTPAPASRQVLPVAPSNLTGDVVAVFDVPVGWQDNSDNEDGFAVYRQRIDLLGTKTKAGQTSRDMTRLLDNGTSCGETYQYTVASFNTVGESPATDCWQITLPACPSPVSAAIVAGNKTQLADFYLGAGGQSFLADQPGQYGLIDLGDLGDTGLDQVTLPEPPGYVRDGIPAAAGHTYAALMKDGQSVVVFSVQTLTARSANITSIVWQPGKTITGACQPLGEAVAGGVCISGDQLCDPNCTGGKDADCDQHRQLLCPPDDPTCDGTTTPPPPCAAGVTSPNCPQPTETVTEPPCVPGSASPNCPSPTDIVTEEPCPPGSASPNCPQPTDTVTEPPPMCSQGWAPTVDQGCVCCGSDQICPDGSVHANANACGERCRCVCVQKDPKTGRCLVRQNSCTGAQC